VYSGVSQVAESSDRDLRWDTSNPRTASAHTAQLLEAHRSALHRYFRHRAQSYEDAEDYVQEVYLRVLAADPHQEKVKSLRGFLFRAASNLLIDKHRRRVASMAAAHFPLDEAVVDDGTNDPERILASRNALEALGEALENLPPVVRDAFLLVRVEGLSHREAAERLNIETKAVSRHVERSLVRLASMMVEATP
jgi:RNA polymerase sigma factor (sigma-70 family)